MASDISNPLPFALALGQLGRGPSLATRHEQIGPLNLDRSGNAPVQPVLDTLGATLLGQAEDFCDARRASKALNQVAVCFLSVHAGD